MHPHSRSPFHPSPAGTQQRSGGRLSVTESGSSLPGQAAYAASAAPYATLVPQTCISEDFNSLLGSVTSESHAFSPDLVGGPLDSSHVASPYMRDYSAVRHSPEQSWDMFPSAGDLSRPEIQVLEAGSQRSSTGYNPSLDNTALQENMYRDADPNSLDGTFRAPFERYNDPGAFGSNLDPSLPDYELPRIQGGGIHRSTSVISNTSGSSIYGHELSSGMANVDLAHEGHETTLPRYRTRRPSRSRSHRDRSSSTPYYSHREPNKQDFRPDARYSQGADMLTPPGALPPSSQGYVSANYPEELPFGLIFDGSRKKNIFDLSEGQVPGAFSNAGEPSVYGVSPYSAQTLDASQAYRGSRHASLSDSDQGKGGLNASKARDAASSSPAGDDQVRVLGSQPKPQCWDHGCNGRTFSTFSNLLRHQREKSGTAAKSYCSKCGAEFTRSTAKKGHEALGKCKHRRNS